MRKATFLRPACQWQFSWKSFRESKRTLFKGFSMRKKPKVFRVEKFAAQGSFGAVGRWRRPNLRAEHILLLIPLQPHCEIKRAWKSHKAPTITTSICSTREHQRIQRQHVRDASENWGISPECNASAPRRGAFDIPYARVSLISVGTYTINTTDELKVDENNEKKIY